MEEETEAGLAIARSRRVEEIIASRHRSRQGADREQRDYLSSDSTWRIDLVSQRKKQAKAVEKRLLMIAIRLDVLLQLRRHWRAIDVLLCNEIESMKEQEEKAAS